MNIGPFQILIIALVILVLFGRGRISEMMGDFGKGVKSFKQGIADDENPAGSPGQIETNQTDTAEAKAPDNSTNPK